MKITSVIEHEGDNRQFVWKHREKNFNTGTQLVVRESQEAVFFMDGKALDLFGPGRYTLSTENLPLLSKLQRIATDGETPFRCEVYFINKVEQMAIKWGTDSKVQYMEPKYQFPISIGASGEMSLRVEDSRKLLVKLVGTEQELRQDSLVAFFRGILMTRIKSYIAQTMRECEITIFQIDELLNDFSDALQNKLSEDFLDYGMSLQRVNVTTVVKPDGDPTYERFKQMFFEESVGIREEMLQQKKALIHATTEAQRIVIESQAIAQKRQQEGYTYQQERGFDVAETMAKNEGVGNFSSAGIGLGMMAGVGGGMGAAVANIATQAVSPLTKSFESQPFQPQNPQPGMVGVGSVPDMIHLADEEQQAASTSAAETPAPTHNVDPMEITHKKLKDLKSWQEEGLISEDEYKEKKAELLAGI